mgnify:FL=1
MTAVEGQETDEVKNLLAEHDKLVEEIFQHEDKDKNGNNQHFIRSLSQINFFFCFIRLY